MPEAKYELTTKIIAADLGNIELYRIKAKKAFTLVDGTAVNVGDLGGFIQFPRNLDQGSTCWIKDNAYVFGDARVLNQAIVSGTSRVFDEAIIAEKTRCAP